MKTTAEKECKRLGLDVNSIISMSKEMLKETGEPVIESEFITKNDSSNLFGEFVIIIGEYETELVFAGTFLRN